MTPNVSRALRSDLLGRLVPRFCSPSSAASAATIETGNGPCANTRRRKATARSVALAGFPTDRLA
jgi:hypothetical protein